MATVNKSDLAREIAEITGMTQGDAHRTIDALLVRIGAHAEQGDTVRLMGFGSFSVKARAARTGRNPATGSPMEIPETRRVVFKAAKRTIAG